ncbi:sensor histidine kinase [Nocardiopsis sp. NPDC101807]|uniref:sensor histidine kinase n=1 Tax=Nocardiopsis sp. NPDC101807 TaxID=3364339 RepID=UPI00381DCB8F
MRDNDAETALWPALVRRPVAVLLTPWPWRALLYLATSAPVAAVWSLLCWPLLTLAGLPLGAVERRRLALVDGAPAPSPHTPPPPGAGPAGWIRWRSREAASWLELAHGLLLALLCVVELTVAAVLAGVPAALLASPVLRAAGVAADPSPVALGVLLGLGALPVSAYTAMVLAAGRARLARALLTAPSGEELAELGERLVLVSRSRTRIVDGFTAERRRIERDLHDGAQQRLTALVMRLGMARSRFDDDPEQARALVEQAHADARAALVELRELVHGIRPAALAERGLVAALEELADTQQVEVAVEAGDVGRLPDAVESTAYFCAAEAVANAARHSGADTVRVGLRVNGGARCGSLLLTVTDDGRGGADPARGSGLTGLADRAAALGGRVSLTSPGGGPTTVEVRIPCGS